METIGNLLLAGRQSESSTGNRGSEIALRDSHDSQVAAVMRSYPTVVRLAKAVNPRIQTTLLSKGVSKGQLALNDNVPTLALLNKAYGNGAAAEWLKIQIDDLLDFIEQPLGVTDDKIVEACELIACRYYYLNVYEIEMWIAEVKTNGKFYGATGGSRLMELLSQYVRERNEDIDRVENRRKQEKILAQRENAANVLNQYTLYLKELEKKAAEGDEQAREILERHRR